MIEYLFRFNIFFKLGKVQIYLIKYINGYTHVLLYFFFIYTHQNIFPYEIKGWVYQVNQEKLNQKNICLLYPIINNKNLFVDKNKRKNKEKKGQKHPLFSSTNNYNIFHGFDGVKRKHQVTLFIKMIQSWINIIRWLN